MTNANPLTGDGLQAAAYFAVGVTSEGSIAGRDLAYRLSFAGNVSRSCWTGNKPNSGAFSSSQLISATAADFTRPDSAACAQECEALDAADKTFGTRRAPSRP